MESALEFEYRGTVEFPRADRYAVADVLDFLSKVVHPCVHHFPHEEVDYPKVYRLIDSQTDFGANAGRPTGRLPCNHCANLRNELRNALVERLRKAVIGEMFELWDNRLGVVKTLRANGSPDWWAEMAAIYRTDLVKFCKGERFRVVFSDNENSASSESFVQAPIPGEDVTSTSSAHASGTDAGVGRRPIPCIQERAIAITKKALEAAWQIECDTGEKATARAVIALLKSWAQSPTHLDDVLTGVTPRGVVWRTSKEEEKEYDRDACSVTLRAWFKRRDKAERGDAA